MVCQSPEPAEKHPTSFIQRVFALLIIVSFFSFSSFSVRAQRLNFIHYAGEDGLVQSQVTGICQDAYHHLWFSTVGGISRFDGKQFVNYTKANGLINNIASSIYADALNRIWIGTPYGLSCFDGKRFLNFTFSQRPEGNIVFCVTGDGSGNIWALVNFRLYKLEHQSFKRILILEDSALRISALSTDPTGNIWASIFKKGLYRLDQNNWKMVLPYDQPALAVHFRTILFDKKDTTKFWLLYHAGVFLFDHGKLIHQQGDSGSNSKGVYLTLNQDQDAALWIGTSKGVFRFDNHVFTHFTQQDGFTDNEVTVIFRDNENNLWFGTNSEGVYRYSFDNFRFIDGSQDLKNPVIMGIVKDRHGRVWLGTYGDGIYFYDSFRRRCEKMPPGLLKAQRINCLYTDDKGDILVGTDMEGIWKYHGNQFSRIDTWSNGMIPSATGFARDKLGRLWIATQAGSFRLDAKKPAPFLKNSFCSAILVLSKDSVLIGTQDGLYLCGGDSTKRVDSLLFSRSPILCMIKKDSLIYISTGEDGIIQWNLKTLVFTRIKLKNRLNSDIIYSLYMDSQDRLWMGTGLGIGLMDLRIKDSNRMFSNFNEDGKMYGAECNQNAVIASGDRLWFGTTKGVIIVNKQVKSIGNAPTHVILQSVSLFGKEISEKKYYDSLSNWYNIPSGLKLPYHQNNLSFLFQGVGFRNAKQVQYQYKLLGSDTSFSAPTYSPFLIYPSLSPGSYRLQVRAFSKGEGFSDNMIDFPFQIKDAIYNENWFRLLLIVLIVSLGIGFQAYQSRIKESRKIKMAELRREEQLKIRQRTSEDFHDELGNKLTRISVLSDILEMHFHSEEAKKIISQMKQNIDALYSGTRDILWSLQPGSDKIVRIMRRLRDFGNELFQETRVQFNFEDSLDGYSEVSLASDISRNIMMIFKEAMNNVLKHADCKQVYMLVLVGKEGWLDIRLKDDGKGFNSDITSNGHGIENMKMRASRIGANFSIANEKSDGTEIKLSVKITQTEG